MPHEPPVMSATGRSWDIAMILFTDHHLSF